MPRIDPRPLFARFAAKLAEARCPECNRTFDPVQASEDYCPRMVPLHCSWCAQRVMDLREYEAWLRQDRAARRTLSR